MNVVPLNTSKLGCLSLLDYVKDLYSPDKCFYVK